MDSNVIKGNQAENEARPISWEEHFDSLPYGSDSINHPAHYNTGKIEVIDFIEDQQLGFHLGNAVKYICRAGRKNSDATSVELSEISDLKKAVWYIQRYIEGAK